MLYGMNHQLDCECVCNVSRDTCSFVNAKDTVCKLLTLTAEVIPKHNASIALYREPAALECVGSMLITCYAVY